MSNSIIRVPKGNDWHIQLLVSEEGSDLHIDLHDVSDLKVELIHQRCGRAITPPYSIGVSGALQIELEAHQQELGLYDARISFTRPNSKYSDGLEHRTISVRDAIKVVHSHEHGDKGVTITAQMASISKGDKGDPGDPTELLDELSRQQTARLNEIATAQRESLTSIGARLSDEQRTALEGLAERLSREQGDKIAQQTERLSTEQASGLQGISDRLSSEQAQTLERQGQERATAQAEALEVLAEEVNRKYDDAIGAIPSKVTDEVVVEVGLLVPNAVDWAVQMQLPDAVALHLPAQVEEQLPAQVESRLPDLVDSRLPDVADRKLPSLVDAKLPPLVDERIAGSVEEAMPNQLTTALPPVVRAELPSAIRGELPALVRPAVQPAVEQVMATDLASRVAQGLQIGTRNMIKGSNGRRVLPSSDTNRYNALRYTITPSRVSTHDSYALSATVEVLSGEANLIAAYIYNGHKPVNTVYDMSIGGAQRLTWVFRGNTDAPAVYTSHPIYIYAGVYGNTIGVSIAVSDVILVSGDTPLLSWTPAPEDAYATLCEERLVALSQARAQLWAQYGKIVPNSALSSETQSAVQRLWTNYDGAYNRLRKALQDVVNQPSEQAYTALSSLSDQHQTAASDLQAGMTEAALALSSRMIDNRLGVNRVKIDAQGLDVDKWYPITMELAWGRGPHRVDRTFRITLIRSLFEGGGQKQPWWTHNNGYHFCLQWSVRPQGWGQRKADRRIYSYYTHYLREGTPVVSMPNQINEGSVEYVYVRGGSIYDVEVVGAWGVPIQIHPDGYIWTSYGGSLKVPVPVLDNINDIVEPKTDLDTLRDEYNASLGRAMSEIEKLKGRVQTLEGRTNDA